MDFVSTRDASVRTSFSDALRRGLAADGGLYMPSEWPPVSVDAGADLGELAQRLIAPFAEGDVLAGGLSEITTEAFAFPAPLIPLTADGRYGVLELYHGPTAAFKDFGARFLAAAFEQLRGPNDPDINIVVATSGDTGGAVAAAFHRRSGMRVTLLFPKGLVSPTQEQQLTCWGDNVVACAVRGTFDDCQRLAKEAFVDPQLREQFTLSSANSINIGRLLPQAAYFAAASLATFRDYGEPLSFIIPSGNLGNAFACAAARAVGLPIGDIVLAHNANRAVVDFLSGGEWRPRPSVATIASAMDVGNPSNMERFRATYPDIAELRAKVSAHSVSDAAIRRRIAEDAEHYGRVWCPHTATAAEVYARLAGEGRVAQRWCIVATAHPAKFPEIIEPIIGRVVSVPERLRALFERTTHAVEIEPTLSAVRDVLADVK